MSLPIAVLAGGLATRLGPLSARLPKVLVDVGGRPFAEHVVELFARHGLRDVVWCVGYLGERVQEALGDGSRWSMSFRYSFDGPALAGTGGALLRALPLLGPAFFVTYGDAYLECDYADVESVFRTSGAPGLMTVFRNEDRWDLSNVCVENGRIVRYDKQQRDPGMRHIDYGLSVLTDDALAPWRTSAGPFDLTVVFQRLIARGALAAYEVHERFYEIGSPAGLAETRARLLTRSRTS